MKLAKNNGQNIWMVNVYNRYLSCRCETGVNGNNLKKCNMTGIIKLQCRDKNGNLLAYHNDCQPHLVSEFIVKWRAMYGDSIHVISVNYF